MSYISPQEHLLAKEMAKLPSKFRRQAQIRRDIRVDFLEPKTKTVVEVDGDDHNRQRGKDYIRDRILTMDGYCVLRFTNAEVDDHPEGVACEVADVVAARLLQSREVTRG